MQGCQASLQLHNWQGQLQGLEMTADSPVLCFLHSDMFQGGLC